jgi:hypothetical protein
MLHSLSTDSYYDKIILHINPNKNRNRISAAGHLQRSAATIKFNVTSEQLYHRYL